MKKFLQDFKSWIIIWTWILFTILVWLSVYAVLSPNWHEPETEVIAWQPLTAQAWNNMQESIKYLKEQMQIVNWFDTTWTYSINRPDLWWTNEEIDFWNWLYWQRFVGNISANAGTQYDKVLISGVSKIVSVGWAWQIGGSYVNWYQANSYINAAGNRFSFVALDNANSNLRFASTTNLARSGTTSNGYDIWALYTK
jgi:hypothetical protein